MARYESVVPTPEEISSDYFATCRTCGKRVKTYRGKYVDHMPALSPLHPEVEVLDHRLEAMREALEALEAERGRLLLRLTNEALGTSYEEDRLNFSPYHTCPTSPSHNCIYDPYEDPAEDDCLFCHDPSERK